MAGLDQVQSALAESTRAAVALCVVAALTACERPGADFGGRAVSSTASSPAAMVDSALPAEELMRRFRVGLTEPPRLDGPSSRDELVRLFLRAVRNKDAAAMRRLVIDRSEFAYLVFPESRMSKPPYRQPPEIAWLLLESGTSAAIKRLIERADQIQPIEYRCPQQAEPEGAMLVSSNCVVTVKANGGTRDVRLFGRIIERDKRFKFAGLAGDL